MMNRGKKKSQTNSNLKKRFNWKSVQGLQGHDGSIAYYMPVTNSALEPGSALPGLLQSTSTFLCFNSLIKTR